MTANKNLGPAVTGYLTPDGRSWETVVTQSGKPLLDREINLLQDLDEGAGQEVARRAMPSGWLSDDFLATSDATSAIHTLIATPNIIEIPALRAHVNGWFLNIQNTGIVTTANRVLLGAAPAGAGAKRTELVVLEVWRRLISASPSTVGKSASGRIWRNGNVKVAPADDLTLNYADDILYAPVAAETSKRVQIQFRLRVINGVDLFAYPYGINDPTVVANSVPASAAAPNGAATLFPYLNQSSNGDPGLWVAGDGNPTNTLGTVDGYMYSIPLLAVFRRNTTAFARLNNQNGAAASPGPSGRPDGLFHDIIASVDVLDLRSGVSSTGWSVAELLEKNTNLILDNAMRTEIGATLNGGGSQGTTLLMENEIGVPVGDGSTTGSTPGGELVANFDAVRRRFSDRSVQETVTVVIPPPVGGWVDGATISINPSALTVYPYSAFNWTSFAPADVQLMDILEWHWAGTSNNSVLTDAEPYVASVSGLGSLPVTALGVGFGAITALNLTHSENLYVTLLVGYPTGSGLSHTPIADYGSASFAFTTAAPSAAAPILYGAMNTEALDFPHREAHLEYQTTATSYGYRAGSAPTTTALLPERALSVSSPAGVLDASGRVYTLSALPGANATVTINYIALRPMPQVAGNEVQMAVYYRTVTPQMSRTALLTSPFNVIPKITSQQLYVFTAGSGSQDESYPYPTAYVQTGGVVSSSPYSGESELAGRAEISVADFNASTGMLKLPIYVPMVANPEALTFTGLGADIENRSYFETVPPGYVPNAYAQDLSFPDRHKNMLPLLAELAADSTLGFKGQLVLILILRYAEFDETNGVAFGDNTTASVFRVKGLLLNKRAV